MLGYLFSEKRVVNITRKSSTIGVFFLAGEKAKSSGLFFFLFLLPPLAFFFLGLECRSSRYESCESIIVTMA